ncbi:MAG TPA: hypothetical protein VNN21_03590 [Dehalococcoidia bacterium]|nr:hypothetical protein [Dehalococcoidia bacterium]
MYYQNQPPKEPSGCLQTLVITRAILGILFVPILLVVGALLLVLAAFYALTISPLLAVAVIAIGGVMILALAKWESRRVAKEAEQFKE